MAQQCLSQLPILAYKLDNTHGITVLRGVKGVESRCCRGDSERDKVAKLLQCVHFSDV